MAKDKPADAAAIVAALYEAAYDRDGWGPALELLAKPFGARASVFGVQNFSTHEANAICTIDADPDYHLSYALEYARHNVVWQTARSLPAGEVYLDCSMISRPEFETTTIYNEWLSPQGFSHNMGTRVFSDGMTSGFIDLHRKHRQSEFDAGDMEYFATFVPTLMRVVELSRTLRVERVEKHIATRALDRLGVAAIAVGGDGRILYGNALAEEIFLRAEAPLRQRHGLLTASSGPETVLIQTAIARICEHDGMPDPGGHFIIGGYDGKVRMALSISPLLEPGAYGLGASSAAIVFARQLDTQDGHKAAERLEKTFGLTSAEARIAIALCSGMSVQDCADSLGIRTTTLRTHLSRLLHKTGTARQGQLVALLKNADIPLRE